MIKFSKKGTFFSFLILLGTLCSIILSSIYFSSIGNKLAKEFVGLKFILNADSSHKTSLIYTYNKEFNSRSVLTDQSAATDSLLFVFPISDSIVKRFRLDFGNDVNLKPLKIKELRLLFKNDEIVLNEVKAFQKLINTSPSILLDKDNRIIKFKNDVVPFDPYIIFSPLVEFTIDKREYAAYLLSPFVILLFVFFVGFRSNYKLSLKEFLILIFILSIPLKIAWTTFFAILICAYGLITTFTKRKVFANKSLAYFFLVFFLMLLVIGRPSSISDIDMQFGLLLWAIISVTIHIPKSTIYRFYTGFIVLLNAVIFASGISFLFWFNELYGLQLGDYFSDIKIYSRDVRSWLYYDHAAFLSFFGVIGILFLHYLYQMKLVNLKWVWLYHLMLISLIVITVTRIGFIIYMFVLLNVVLTLNFRRRLAMNTILLGTFAALLFINIGGIDKSRSTLWETSWEAIKTRPLFGYGLGQSDKTLHAAYYNKEDLGLPLLELNHSHNQFLTYLLELGFIGFSILVLGVLVFLIRTRQYKNSMMMVYLFALGFLFLTESALQTSKPLYVLSFLLLLVYADKNIENIENSHQ